jgi:hypothetical protein
MTPAAATYDHATAVADIIAGYHRTEMALRREDTSTLELDYGVLGGAAVDGEGPGAAVDGAGVA